MKAFQYNDWDMFNSGMKSLCRQTLILSPLICVAAGVFIQPILLLIDKEVYFSHVVVLYILLLAIFLFSISMIPHYGLYAMNQDKAIIKSNVTALLVFLGLGVFFWALLVLGFLLAGMVGGWWSGGGELGVPWLRTPRGRSQSL